MNVPVDPEEATQFRQSLDHWISCRPIPGQPYMGVGVHDDQQKLFDMPVDAAALIRAQQVPPILARGRDSFIFGPNDVDDEARESRRRRRPYNHENIKLS
jgi:hypothetical protein